MQRWASANLRTGAFITSLPAIEPEWPLRHSIAKYDPATVHLNLDGAPVNWESATLEGGAVLFTYDDEVLPDGSQPNAIEWAGYVNAQTRQASAGVVDLSLTTVEAYLDRRYVGDEEYTIGWKAIAEDLVTKYVIEGEGDEPGLQRLRVVRDDDGEAPPAGDPIIMQNTDNATVFARIGELTARFGGEWTIEWDWSDDGKALVPTLYISDRIGRPVTGSAPAVTFQNLISDLSQDRDYSDGRGANKIVAFSSGQGEVTPYAEPVVAADFRGRPTFEYRYAPETSQSDTDVLTAEARKALPFMQDGAQPISVQLARDNPEAMIGRRLNVDWRMGDDVGYQLEDIAFPGGLKGVARIIAYELYAATINPTFAQPEIFDEAA